MRVTSVHDRAELAELLSRDPARYAYQLGDLDDFFWPYTTWYRLGDVIALVYHGGELPTLLAYAAAHQQEQLAALLAELGPLLPRSCYAHLSPGAARLLPGYRASGGGPHQKFALTDLSRLPEGVAGVTSAGELPEVLAARDLPELVELYRISYPGNWFDPRMLQTGQYVGIRRDGELLSVAGVHVWSPAYRVCALGNVTTRPDVRGQGLGRRTVAALCRRLLDSVDVITLNVAAGNRAAIGLYAGLGFTRIADYDEALLTSG
jgi:GNAT superfamily N-acetyltransferase